MALLYAKTVLRVLLLPPYGLLLLALIGLLVWHRRPRLARASTALALVVMWSMSLPSVANHLERWAANVPALDASQPVQADAVVIIGEGGQRALAPEYGGPSVRDHALDPLAYDAWIAKKTALPVLVSGNGLEAQAMAATLDRNFDLPPRWVEDRSWDTFDNARNSVRLLRQSGINRIILVTRATHMQRSVAEFEAAGAQVIPAPSNVWAPGEPGLLSYLPQPDALTRSYLAVYELLGRPMRQWLAITHLRRQERE